MLDSNGCGGASEESKANGHTKTSVGFGQDQIDWYTAGMNAVKKSYGDVKISMAFHIQTAAFAPAYEKYDYSTALNGNKDLLTPIDLGNGGDGGDFGYLGRNPKGPWGGDLFVKMKASGVDSVFVGHEHCNSISVVYEGVRLQYGQKSSTYDRANYLTKDGTIVGSYEEKGTPIVGGTIIPLSEEGVITKPALVLYKEEVVNVPVYTSVFDFNGTDFDAEVTTDGITYYVEEKKEVASKPISSGVPAGGDGGVYGNSSGYLVSVGINFNFNINVEDLKTFKIRMYVSDYTVATGRAALVRLYDATNNDILVGKSFSDAEGKTGEWCEVDILPLIKEEKAFSALVSEGKLQPLSLVYRAYAATGEIAQVYFDSVIIESLVDYSLSEAA